MFRRIGANFKPRAALHRARDPDPDFFFSKIMSRIMIKSRS